MSLGIGVKIDIVTSSATLISSVDVRR